MGADAAKVLRLTDEAMVSPYWWSYIHALDLLDNFLVSLTAFSTSCPCHPPELISQCKERERTDLVQQVMSCP